MKSMVDERFELSALIFRLAGRPEFNETDTEYQCEVAETFAEFSEHPAVKLAKSYDIERTNGIFVGYDAVAKFAVHIEKKSGKFVFINDIGSLFDNGRWNEAAAKEFLPLFNDFYTDTDYGEFFNSRLSFFEKETQGFITTYNYVDLEWFGKYVDPSNLRCIYSPSILCMNYAVTVNEKIVYCVATATASSSTIVHEYCHSFGNILGNKWYAENEEFRKWCDDSVNLELNPYYDNGFTMSGEYVTRAYNILYCCQCGGEMNYKGIDYKWSEFAPIQMKGDYERGFRYIGEVYGLVHSINSHASSCSSNSIVV